MLSGSEIKEKYKSKIPQKKIERINEQMEYRMIIRRATPDRIDGEIISTYYQTGKVD